jgi:hypothetical protein
MTGVGMVRGQRNLRGDRRLHANGPRPCHLRLGESNDGQPVGLRRVRLVCHVHNVATRQVQEKCQFVFVDPGGDEYWLDRARGRMA